jgi:hypothetical protein
MKKSFGMAHALSVALLVVATGCGPSRTPAQAVPDLAAADAEVRLKAARDIETGARKDGSLPADIVDKLLAQAKTEPDFKTKASILIALGYTGDERAKPLLDAYAQTEDPQQRTYAARALKKWSVKTGKFPAEYKFPPDWPYGTEGYPAPLPK